MEKRCGFFFPNFDNKGKEEGNFKKALVKTSDWGDGSVGNAHAMQGYRTEFRFLELILKYLAWCYDFSIAEAEAGVSIPWVLQSTSLAKLISSPGSMEDGLKPIRWGARQESIQLRFLAMNTSTHEHTQYTYKKEDFKNEILLEERECSMH